MPRIVPIDDPGDARIENYRDIRERDLVGRGGMFVAEGKVVLEKLVASRSAAPLSVLVAHKRLASLQPLLDQLPADLPVFAAAQDVLDKISGFPLHRGILALARRIEAPTADAMLGTIAGAAYVLFLSGIANHDNIGGIFRNAAAFGAKAILLDSDCCDPLYRKAIRVSVGATFLVPWARLDRGEDALRLFRKHGFDAVALSPAGSELLAELEPSPRTVLLLGAEGPGLSRELIEGARSVRIEMAAGFDSLNVATTSGIVLHHLSAARR